MSKQKLEDLIQDIYDSGEGPEIAAFFDFDRTLIAGFSAKSFLQEQLTSGKMSPRDLLGQVSAIVKYSRGKLNFSGFMAETASQVRGQAEYVFEEFGEEVYRKKVAGAIYPEARALLDAHMEMGHTIAIVSSATKYQIEPAARELGIEYILCTDLEVEDGIFTGRVMSPTCFGDGKRVAAAGFSDAFGLDMGQSFFYTDSEDDLPLLDAVGRPRVVNPSKDLKKIADERSWGVTYFQNRERPTLKEVARVGTAYGILPTAFAATAPLWPLSGKKRTALNAATSMFSDFAAGIIGLDIDVEGEEHIWSHRPAVFIFNHQSSIDPVIMGKLLRRDVAGIGKAEIKRFPIVGQVLQYADTVFIDRSSPEEAIASIQALTERMHDEQLSVALAPEGTRSRGRALGRFKKGAFHIAMQAKVPIVPVVIHNASDSQPKGYNIARPAEIKVTVLPPVKTGRWTERTMEKNIAKIRADYLEVLGQVDLDPAWR